MAGKVWGYDITLFNYFHEKEILIEIERKFFIDNIIPPTNGIIYIGYYMEDNPLILSDDILNDKLLNKKFIYSTTYDYSLRYILVGYANVGKSNFVIRLREGDISFQNIN